MRLGRELGPATCFRLSEDNNLTSEVLRNFVVTTSKSLAEVTSGGSPVVVQYIHESVRDYLTKDNGMLEVFGEEAYDTTVFHHHLRDIGQKLYDYAGEQLFAKRSMAHNQHCGSKKKYSLNSLRTASGTDQSPAWDIKIIDLIRDVVFSMLCYADLAALRFSQVKWILDLDFKHLYRVLELLQGPDHDLRPPLIGWSKQYELAISPYPRLLRQLIGHEGGPGQSIFALEDPRHGGTDDHSILKMAVSTNKVAVVQVLLRCGADANQPYQPGSSQTMLTRAVAAGHNEVARQLLAHGASPDIVESRQDHNS